MSPVSDTAALAAIGAAARELKLPAVRAGAARLAEIAVRERQTHLGYLAGLLSAEIDDRTGRRRTRRIAEPGSPGSSGWSTSAPTPSPALRPPSPRRRLDRRRRARRPTRRLRYWQDPSAHRLGAGRLRAGRRVRYATTAQLVNELGYVQLDPHGAELLFQIITEREERASIAIGTNLPFSEWGTVILDPRLVAAIVDRVTFNAHIVETGTESYRLRTSKTTTRRKPMA
jgi:IstB-like ATP binding protein